MGLLNITEMILLVRKYFLRIVAFSLAAVLLGACAAESMQTYTCKLGFKYNYTEASEGMAPDGESKLDPYEILNPVVIQAALRNMGLTNSGEMEVRGIRENITLTPVVTSLDREVSDSAALLGEKYDVFSTEYEMSFTYDADKGDSFGTMMFSNIIKEYDNYLLAKYYNKKNINDFAKNVLNSDAEYMVIADAIASELDDIIEYLDSMSEYYPDFRSKKTGYSFSELSLLYQNLRDIEYAKYYGNVRAGNLAKDNEMVVKSYQKKVKDLKEEAEVSFAISENYKKEIVTFYDSYKEAGLYRQAQKVQQNINSSNNRDQDVLEDEILEEYQNTYDEIILNYADNANDTTDAYHEINYYTAIIDAYTNDGVSQEEKAELIAKNEIILSDIAQLSEKYSIVANESMGELYNAKISEDLQYLILPEVAKNIPVKLIAVFLGILAFGMAVVFIFVWHIAKKFMNPRDVKEEKERYDADECRRLLAEQAKKGFTEFFTVYQPMISKDEGSKAHSEVFVRWKSEELGLVAPGKIIDTVSQMGIFGQFNDWIVKTVCEQLAQLKKSGGEMPIVHINCPYSEVKNYVLSDIIVKYAKKYRIPFENICVELDGKNISQSMEEIMVLEEMGVKVCIDRFENSEEEKEIIDVVKPEYIKISSDILNGDMYSASEEDLLFAEENMKRYFKEIVGRCHENGIKACICGVENKRQDKIASEAGFDYKQGFYYGKPKK